MSEFAVPQLKVMRRTSPYVPVAGVEEVFPYLDKKVKDIIGSILLKPMKERIKILMAGSMCNDLSLKIANEILGATAYAAVGTVYGGLWTAAIDDTLLGNTANEATYGSYARLALTNNTTIFDGATGSTTATKQFPADATKSWATSTSGSNTITYLGFLTGNAGTSADKGMFWASVTSVTINSGDTPQLAVDAVTIVFD